MTPATVDTTDENVNRPLLLGEGEEKAASKKGRTQAPKRYVATPYARATEDEKRRIERLALAAGLSVSRFLVRAAAEEKLPPSREERARLEGLLYRFKRASLFLDHLVTTSSNSGMTAGIEKAGDVRGVPKAEEVREAARLLASLANELKRRL